MLEHSLLSPPTETHISVEPAEWRLSPGLLRLLNWFCALTPESACQLGRYYRDDSILRDPLGEAQGVDAILHLFTHAFLAMGTPLLTIERALEQGREAAIFWRFECQIGKRNVVLAGMSALQFARDGRVQQQVNYWDSATLITAFPIWGAGLRWLKARVMS